MKQAVLQYPGGKFRLAPWIIERMPSHLYYVEPFGGAASVLMQKPRAIRSEVFNDLNDDVVNLFRVLRDPDTAGELRRLCELTPFARTELLAAQKMDAKTPVGRAHQLLVRSWMAVRMERTETGRFVGHNIKRGGCRSNAWKNWPNQVPAMVERLRGVVIECKDGIELLKQYDSPETLHYVDPPYPHDTRVTRNLYLHEMNSVQHELLRDTLAELQGYVVLSTYQHPIYDELDWRRETRSEISMLGNPRIEALYCNFESPQRTLFSGENI